MGHENPAPLVPTKDEIIAALRREVAEHDAEIERRRKARDEAALTLQYLTGERVRLKTTRKKAQA